jgi:hypothetical protein
MRNGNWKIFVIKISANWKIFVIKNFCKLENRTNNFLSCHGGVAQWTSHPPQEQKTRVWPQK